MYEKFVINIKLKYLRIYNFGGKNKNVAHEAIAEWVIDILTRF